MANREIQLSDSSGNLYPVSSLTEETMSLTDAKKTLARSNIGAASEASVGSVSSLNTTAKGSLVAAVNELVTKAGVYVRTFSAVSSLPQTISDDANIVDNMKPVNIEVSNMSAMGGDWTVTSADGSLTLSGTFVSGQTTDVTVSLAYIIN